MATHSESAGGSSVDISKTTFLVVDDKTYFRDMVHTALQRAGAREVKHAKNVEVGLELLSRCGQAIGCVICDWDMAPIGGLELLRMIRCRTLPRTSPHTPVVILTARADANAVKAAMALDVNGFAVAPLSFEKLVKTVTNGLARTWTLQAASHYGAVPAVTPPALSPESKPHAKHSTAPSDAASETPITLSGKPLPRRKTELKNVHMCILSDVQPGAILARDLHDQRGQLLLKTGTELKASLIDRLRNVADGHAESYHVWIGERGAE